MFKQKHQRGFSLIEVMIAMAVFLIGITGVTSALWYGTHASHHGQRITEATNHARSMMEALKGRNYIDNAIPMVSGWPGATSGINDGATERRALDDPPFLNAHLHNADLRSYRRNVTVTRVSNDNTSHEFGLAVVVIRVYWFEKETEKSIEMRSLVTHAL